MNEVTLLYQSQIVAAMLVCLGLVGFLSRRNMIIVFLSAEMMLQGVSVSLVAWGRYHNDFGGQVLTIFILTVAACEAALALALVMMLYRRTGTLDLARWNQWREESQTAYTDHELPEESVPAESVWPHLTPAGVQPDVRADDVRFRSHV